MSPNPLIQKRMQLAATGANAHDVVATLGYYQDTVHSVDRHPELVRHVLRLERAMLEFLDEGEKRGDVKILTQTRREISADVGRVLDRAELKRMASALEAAEARLSYVMSVVAEVSHDLRCQSRNPVADGAPTERCNCWKSRLHTEPSPPTCPICGKAAIDTRMNVNGYAMHAACARRISSEEALRGPAELLAGT